MEVQEPGEPLPRMLVLSVVIVRQHRGEPPLLVQCEAASISKFSELMDDKGDPLLEVLDEILDPSPCEGSSVGTGT